MSAVSESICNSTRQAERLERSYCWLPIALAVVETPEPGWCAMGIKGVVNGDECELFKHVERHIARVQASDADTTAEVIASWPRRHLESWLAVACR